MANNKDELVITLSLASLNLVKTITTRVFIPKLKVLQLMITLVYLLYSAQIFFWIQAKQTPAQ